MATTRLSDAIIPDVYLSYTAVNSPEKTAFFESGLVVRNAMLDQKANSAGEQVNIPYWNDLDASVAPNLSTTDPAVLATPQKVTASKMIGQVAYLNQSFSNADLVAELAGSSPNQHIRNRFGTYWTRQWQRRLIATANGVLADNIAANSGDMVVNIASNSIAGQSASTKFNLNSFVDATHTMGDMASELTAIAVHSSVHAQMVKNDDIVYIPDSQGRLTIPTYMGLRVIVDDSLTVTAGTTDGFKYTSVIFGQGAFGYGEGSAETPVEVDRSPLQGNGGGVEYLIERKTWLLHPFGFSVTAQGAVETGAHTLAELAAATTWERKLPRKSCPIAFMISN
jgi:hypothetical protein